MKDLTQTGFSLVEVLIATALSMLLISSLLWLLQDVLSMSTVLQQQRLLQQHGWILDRTLSDIFEHAGDSTVYPATNSDWKALSQQPALRLYQVGIDPLPDVLQAHWHNKLLAGSTVIESQSISKPTAIAQASTNQITLHTDIQAKPHSLWLLVSPNAWQLVALHALYHRGMESILSFDQAITPTLQLPYLAGRYQHHLWFVALNRQIAPNHQAQYGLYQWDLTDGSSPQEIVSGIVQWHGQFVASQQATTMPLAPATRVFHWLIQWQAGHLSRLQHFYYLNQNLR
jgi:hypothetical protein